MHFTHKMHSPLKKVEVLNFRLLLSGYIVDLSFLKNSIYCYK
jgi:hypothetical protein